MWHWLVWFLSFWRTPPPSNTLKKEKFQRAVHIVYLTFFEITTAWRVKAFLSRRCFFQRGWWAESTRKDQPASCCCLELGLPFSVSFPLLSKENTHTHTHTHSPQSWKIPWQVIVQRVAKSWTWLTEEHIITGISLSALVLTKHRAQSSQ